MYKGIVLDKMQRNAFLSMAAQEGLICEKGKTDGVFDMVTHHTPSLWFARMILEQFTVAGAIYVDPFTYGCMDGELIEKKLIMPYQKCEDDVEGFFTFDIDTVQWMMAEKGLDIKCYTIDRIREIYDEWNKKVEEFLEFERQYNVSYSQLRFLKTFELEPKRDYTGIDIDHLIELGDFIYRNPLIEVLEEYKELFNIAYHNDLLSPVINAANSDTADSSYASEKVPVIEGAETIKILKYTSKRLDRIYTASSLKDNVKLVQTDEAKAYREKVDEWMSAISKQNYDNMQMIEDDIVKVQKAMKFKGVIENVGKVCATSGVIATVLTPILPPMGVVAAMATFVGMPTAFLNPMKRHLWASFGIYNK